MERERVAQRLRATDHSTSDGASVKRTRLNDATPEERIATYTRRDANGCLRWTRGLTKDGYAQVSLGGGRQVYAHRFVYELHVAKIPSGLVIDHLCGNRDCLNHEHMEIVTRAENTRRGGPVQGTRNGHAKLNEEAVREIRRRYGVEPTRVLAERFGVSPRAIRWVGSGGTWKHVKEVAA